MSGPPRGGLKGLIASRAKLGLAVGALAALWALLLMWMPPWIRGEATSNAVILLVLLVYALLVFGIVGGLAILVGDRLFEKGWRERLVGGPPPDSDTPPKSHVLGFSALFVVGVIGLGALSEVVTGGLLAEYQAKGAKRVTLRSDDVAEKLEVIEALGEERREERVKVAVELLDEVWRNPGESVEVRRAAFGALGGIVGAMNGAVDQWRLEGKPGRWQEVFATELRKTLGPELVAARRSAEGGLRADLSRLLGLLRAVEVEDLLIESLSRAKPVDPALEPDAEWVAAVQSLMELRTSRALFAVGVEIGRHEPIDDGAVALLALAVSKLFSAYHFARPELDERTMPEVEREGLSRVVESWLAALASPSLAKRCAAAVALQRTRHGAALEPLLVAFDKAERGVMCKTEVVELGLSRGEALGANLLLRHRLLDAIAVLSADNPRVKAWVGEKAAAAARGEIERELEPTLLDFLARL